MSTKAVSCFCSFTDCKVMVFTKGNCGVGMETWEGDVKRAEGGEGGEGRGEGWGSVAVSSTRGEGRQERAVSGLVRVPPQCCGTVVCLGER